RIKGIDVLLESIPLLAPEDRERLELRLIGDGPERARLESLAEHYNLLNTVKFLGMRSDVVKQLQGLDVFVLPSRREGRPMSVMEAMAVGLPVLATQVGALDTLVEDGVHGHLVPSGSPQSLAVRIQELIREPSRRARYGRNARQKAMDEFSIDQ